MLSMLDADYAHAVAWQKTQRTRTAARQQRLPRRAFLRFRAIRPAHPLSPKRDL